MNHIIFHDSLITAASPSWAAQQQKTNIFTHSCCAYTSRNARGTIQQQQQQNDKYYDCCWWCAILPAVAIQKVVAAGRFVVL
jgi:hypothetical protein